MNQVLVLALVVMVGIIIFGILTIFIKAHKETNGFGLIYRRGTTNFNFDLKAVKEFKTTHHGQHIAAEYAPRKKRYLARKNRAEKRLDRAAPGSVPFLRAQRSVKANDTKLRQTIARERHEIGLMSRMFQSSAHRSRLSGNDTSHGIGRAGHGTRRAGFTATAKKKQRKGGK